MTGHRAPDGSEYHETRPGAYWKQTRNGRALEGHRGRDWDWVVHCPDGSHGSLTHHDVVEHDDGTITVSPSILVTGAGSYHGYLERGEWRPA